jgi:hypothetical protein
VSEPLPNAYGFGPRDNAYLRFATNPKGFEKESEYEFSFYTYAKDGILLAVSMTSKWDYESIWIEDGKLKYTFNAGSGNLILPSTTSYNDGKWHKVKTTRSVTTGTLTVDDVLIGSGTSRPGASSVNAISNIYLGGLPANALRSSLIKSTIGSIRGAIGGIKIKKSAMLPSEKKLIINAYGGGLQDGVQVGEKGGYLQKSNAPEVLFNYDISMNVRTKYRRGYVFFSKAEKIKDMLSLQITADSSLMAVCDNGGGAFSVSVKSPTICDGNFHTVSLSKRGRSMTLTVDGVSQSITSVAGSSAANTGKAPLYIGGLPAPLQSDGYQSFTGCITDIKVKTKSLDLGTDTVTGGEALRGCGVPATKLF